MKVALVALTALSSASAASLLGSASSKPKYDVWLRADGCSNLDREGEPYVYAGIDASSLPGTTKYVQTGIGKNSGVLSKLTTFEPDNVLFWGSVPDPLKQKLEVYLYGQDTLRPDSKLGEIDIKLKKVDTDCTPFPLKDQVVDSDWFSRDARCDFTIAICPIGEVPVNKDGSEWEATGKKSKYTKGF